jgi:hypothetical protein
MANNKRVTRTPSRAVPSKSATKKNAPPPPPPGPVDDMNGFDEENGGVIHQAVTQERINILDEELHDDLEFSEEPGDTSPPPSPLTPDINSMPRPQQPSPKPTRHVIAAAEAQRAMKGGGNPGNPIKSAHPFRGGSVLNGHIWPDVDRKFCEVIFRRVKDCMTENGVMNVRNQTKADVKNAFIQVLRAPFENKEFFPDMVEQFCLVHNILKK